MWCGKSQGCFFGAFFWTQFFSFFFDVGSILGGFGRPKRRRKSIFGTFFFDAFFECVLVSIFDRFWEARNLKNSNFTKEKQGFSQNWRFRKSSEQDSILGPFLEGKIAKNREKVVLKNMCFFDFDFFAFFCEF